MTDTTTAPDSLEEPAVPGSEDQSSPNREAAKYRTRLREVEASLEPLNQQLAEARGRIEGLQRQILERAITEQAGVAPAGVLAVHKLEDFLDESGNVDPAKVTELAGKAAADLGLARLPRAPRPDPTQGGRGSVTPVPTWSDLLQSR